MRPTTMRPATGLLFAVAAGCLSSTLWAGEPPESEDAAVLFFREDWAEAPPGYPVTREHLANPRLVVALHGPERLKIKLSHHDPIPNDPWYTWSGLCTEGRWAISLKKKNGSLVDLSAGQIRWRVKQSGAHVLKVLVERADGSWLVSEKGFGETPDWHVFDLPLSILTWRTLDIGIVQTGDRLREPDLSRVKSVGWTDLMPGEGSPGCTRVDWIEVYGDRVGR